MMDDTSLYDAKIYKAQLLTQALCQRAAEEELGYWKRRREILEAEHSTVATALVSEEVRNSIVTIEHLLKTVHRIENVDVMMRTIKAALRMEKK